MVRTPVALNHASRLVNHGPTVLVTSAHAGRRNVMAAAWSMPVEFTPPRIAVVVDKSTYSRELIAASGTLALNLPCALQADLCNTVGNTSGREMAPPRDKFERYGIGVFIGSALGLPLVEGCVAWLECRVIPERHTETAYDTFFVEVISAEADARVFANGRWHFDDTNRDLHTLHHLGGGVFAVPSRIIAARPLPER